MATSLYPLRLYLRYLPHRILLTAIFFIHIGLWLWTIVTIGFPEEALFLHYNILYGVDLVDSGYKIYYLPFAGLCIALLNALLGWVVFHKNKFAALLLNSVSLICQIFLFFQVGLLLFLNG